MALLSFPLSQNFTCTKLQRNNSYSSSRLSINSAAPSSLQNTTATTASNGTILRRSANYQPPIWDYNYVQSIDSKFKSLPYINRINHLKDDVRKLLDQVENPPNELKLIDTLQRLGLAYHFQDEIKKKLAAISKNDLVLETKDLYTTALGFRLLRQYGYESSEEVFDKFKDDEGNFRPSLAKEIDGILSLYEASYISEKGERILKVARDFATKILENNVIENEGEYHSILASHALELPLHWRMPRVEARWFIDAYERDETMNPVLLQLAKLDFNKVQAVHQDDLKHISKWWMSTNLDHADLSFARERIIESFFWSVGISSFQPDSKLFLRHCTKLIQLITTIDDFYDVYGTLDELELFTSAVERWEISAIEQLPDYMKNVFLVLYNSIEEMASDIFEKHGVYVISQLHKPWADLLKKYLLEAKWYHNGYTPTLEEYIGNAWLSISGSLILVYAYFLASDEITEEAMKCLKEYPNLVRWSSTIFRLINDIGTSPDELERGDVLKAAQCYMQETGASELEAKEHIKDLIRQTWEKMNKECAIARSIFPDTFVDMSLNITRMALCSYLHGDGFGRQDNETTIIHIQSLLFNPIDIKIMLVYFAPQEIFRGTGCHCNDLTLRDRLPLQRPHFKGQAATTISSL